MIVERTWEGYPSRTYEYGTEEEAAREVTEFFEENLADPFYAGTTAWHCLTRGGMIRTKWGDVEVRRIK